MKRHKITPRPGWQHLVASKGLTCHTLADGSPYWDESAYWEFSVEEIDRLEAATAEIHTMALAAADFVLTHDRFAQMAIPAAAIPSIRASWEQQPPSIYGRLDLACDGTEIKLLEYNADTPTALVEAAVIQWYWLQDCFPAADQFNSLHEKLVARWKALSAHLDHPVYFGHMANSEDWMTINYLRETAGQAGIRHNAIAMRDIGWEAASLPLRRSPAPTHPLHL